MSEPDNPRWLSDVSDELRREEPVRAAWRARLLEDVARSRRPSVTDDFDDRFEDVASSALTATSRRRTITLTPVTGLAAAALFAVLGAGVMYGVMSGRSARRESPRDDSRAASPGVPSATRVSRAAATDRETVRF